MPFFKTIIIVCIFSVLSYPMVLTASQPERFLFSDLRENAGIQWELARSGCHVGAVDGIIRVSGRKSRTEKCLEEQAINSTEPAARILAELYMQKNDAADKRFDIEAIKEAMAGLFVPEGIPRRLVRPNREDRARVARESLSSLHPSRLLLFLLVGMDMDSSRIRTLSKTLLDREKFALVQPEAWDLTLDVGRMTNGVRYYLQGLDKKDRIENTLKLLSYAQAKDTAVNGDELLATLVAELWGAPEGMNDGNYATYLQPLVALLLEEAGNLEGGKIDETCMSVILRQFGNTIFGPLIKQYLVAGDYSKEGKRILAFIQEQDQIVPAVKSISARLNGSTDDFQLLRLLHRITDGQG